MDWSVEREIAVMVGAGSADEALHVTGLLDERSRLNADAEIRVLHDWWRSGAETYSFVFEVKSVHSAKVAIMKSCVAFGGMPLAEIFSEWLKRRSILSQAGVQVPKLYCHDKATLVEEYIDYEFFDYVASLTERRSMLFAAGETAGKIARAGFIPMSLLDWRSRGHDVVVVDFGQDLGVTANHSHSGLTQLSEIVSNLEAAGVQLRQEELMSLEEGYSHAGIN